MLRSTTCLAVALFSVAVCLSQGSADAQYRYNPYAAFAQAQAFQRNMYQQQLLAANAGQVYGTNYGIPIYANSVANYYTPNYGAYNAGFAPNYFAPPVVPYAGGYGNPYAPTAPAYGANPYSPVDPALGNPYSPYNPYGAGYGAGSVLMGQADIMRAYGNVITSEQQAWLLKSKVDQEKLNTVKQKFDLDMYIKANTPTYNQEQERIAKATLRRIQTNSLPGEVTNGKSLNYLLDDLRKYPGKKTSGDAIQLSEGVLNHLNVAKKGNHGMGVLRQGLSWPAAVQELIPVTKRKDLEAQLDAMVKKAGKGQSVDANALKDVRNEIEKLREELIKKANEIATPQYIDAKRFVQELYEGTRALENGEAKVQADFQKFVEGGKTVQEVTDYMVNNGLRFTGASATDEAAYRVIHSALASHNIALNTQLGISDKE